MSVVNWEELSKVAADGDDPLQVAERLQTSDSPLSLEPLIDSDYIKIARLRPRAKARGLSLADRASLALAKWLDLPVVTADPDWADLKLGKRHPAHPLKAPGDNNESLQRPRASAIPHRVSGTHRCHEALKRPHASTRFGTMAP